MRLSLTRHSPFVGSIGGRVETGLMTSLLPLAVSSDAACNRPPRHDGGALVAGCGIQRASKSGMHGGWVLRAGVAVIPNITVNAAG